MTMSRLFGIFEVIVFRFSRWMGAVAIVVLGAMMFFTVLDVFLRAFFNTPIRGDVEIIELAMVCVGFLGLAWCAMRGMHIQVDLLVTFFSKKGRSAFDVFNYLLGMGVCFIFTYKSVAEGIANRELNNLSAVLKIPLFPFYWIVAVGYAMLLLAVIVLFFKALVEVIKK